MAFRNRQIGCPLGSRRLEGYIALGAPWIDEGRGWTAFLLVHKGRNVVSHTSVAEVQAPRDVKNTIEWRTNDDAIFDPKG